MGPSDAPHAAKTPLDIYDKDALSQACIYCFLCLLSFYILILFFDLALHSPPDFLSSCPQSLKTFSLHTQVLKVCSSALRSKHKCDFGVLTLAQGQLPWKETLDVTLPHSGHCR